MPKEVALRPCPREPKKAAVLAVTKNRRGGTDQEFGYCIAALDCDGPEGPRLVRPVPLDAHFWNEGALPTDIRVPPGSLVTIGYEEGVLPDTTHHPHRGEDVVAHKLECKGPAEDFMALHGALGKLAKDSLKEVWPKKAWATPLSLHAGLEVPSLMVFRGRIDRVIPRDVGSPIVDLRIADQTLQRIPYAAHRMHGDRGVGLLWQKKNLNTCLLLLGLARAHCFSRQADNTQDECRILLLGALPG